MVQNKLKLFEKNRELFNLLNELLLNRVEEFLDWMETPLKPAIRANTLKIKPEELKVRLERQGFKLTPIPFYKCGFEVEEAPFEIGKTVEHFLGYYYVQQKASMLPPLILNPEPGEFVLDIAAAPGSKTTQMAQMMQNTGVIVANDVSIERVRALSHNIDKLGVLNTIVTELDGYKFGRFLENRMDKVLIDAPCSAIGTLHKTYEPLKWWSWGVVGNLVRTQKGLILAGYRALRPGGRMVYSTCTLVPEENEGVVNFLLSRHPEARILDIPDFGLEMEEGIIKWKRNTYDERVKKTRRLYPFRNGTEGFYFALIEKPFSEI